MEDRRFLIVVIATISLVSVALQLINPTLNPALNRFMLFVSNGNLVKDQEMFKQGKDLVINSDVFGVAREATFFPTIFLGIGILLFLISAIACGNNLLSMISNIIIGIYSIVMIIASLYCVGGDWLVSKNTKLSVILYVIAMILYLIFLIISTIDLFTKQSLKINISIFILVAAIIGFVSAGILVPGKSGFISIISGFIVALPMLLIFGHNLPESEYFFIIDSESENICIKCLNEKTKVQFNEKDVVIKKDKMECGCCKNAYDIVEKFTLKGMLKYLFLVSRPRTELIEENS